MRVCRYGFNGKENDNEVKGIEGSQIDYGMRVYDPRIGKFLSVDPLSSKYPFYTPYQFSGNTPIQAVDVDGREDVHYVFIWVKAATGKEVVLKLHGWSEGKATGEIDAQGNPIFDRPYKVHAHYPTNLYGRTVFSTATYDSEESFSKAKGSDFYWSAIGEASNVSAEIANDVGGVMGISYLFAKAGNYLTSRTISMLVDAKAAQYTASTVNRPAVDALVKQHVDDALEAEVAAARTGSATNGESLLAAFKSDLPNSFKGIDKKHLNAAIGDMNGRPIINLATGRPWDHLDDISGHMRSLNGRIKELNKLINSGSLKEGVLKEAEALRGSLQKQYDSYRSALTRAANQTGTSINLKKR